MAFSQTGQLCLNMPTRLGVEVALALEEDISPATGAFPFPFPGISVEVPLTSEIKETKPQQARIQL